MRAHRSAILGMAGAVSVVLSLSACVPSATLRTADTLAPLLLPVPTVAPTTTAPPVAVTTILDPASAVTLVTIATTAPRITSLAATSTTGGGTSTTVANKAPNAIPSSYTVANKDTLSGIGRRCATTPQAIADYNSWSDGIAHPLYPGAVVKLPCTPEGTTAPTTTTSVKSSSASTTTTTTTVKPGPGGLYTIVAGDYLAGIAAKTGTTVDAIIAVNGWTDGTKHLIVAGQQIKLPAKK